MCEKLPLYANAPHSNPFHKTDHKTCARWPVYISLKLAHRTSLGARIVEPQKHALTYKNGMGMCECEWYVCMYGSECCEFSLPISLFVFCHKNKATNA